MSGRGARPSRAQVSGLLEHLHFGRFSGAYFFVVIFVIFAIWVPGTFLTSVTWKTILISQALTGILALAVLTPFATGMFDLSVAQTMGFSAVVFGFVTTRGPHLGLVCDRRHLGCRGLRRSFQRLPCRHSWLGQLDCHTRHDIAAGRPLCRHCAWGVLGPLLALGDGSNVWICLGGAHYRGVHADSRGDRVVCVGAHARSVDVHMRPELIRMRPACLAYEIRRFRFWSLVSCSTIAALAGVLLRVLVEQR